MGLDPRLLGMTLELSPSWLEPEQKLEWWQVWMPVEQGKERLLGEELLLVALQGERWPVEELPEVDWSVEEMQVGVTLVEGWRQVAEYC